MRFRRRGDKPWWTPYVVIDSTMVRQMLASPAPRASLKPNAIQKPGGEVFKSIGN